MHRSRIAPATLDALIDLAEGLLPADAVDDLRDTRRRMAEGRLNVVALGEFKRGKSTLINALLGCDVLPTGVIPLTSTVTVIGHGPRERLLVVFEDGHDEEHPIEDLATYVTEDGNPGNRLGVRLARIELDHELLTTGLVLVDTPGVGSIHAGNTAAARGFLPRVDATLFVLDAGQPLSEPERELLVEAARRAARLLVVVNKIDHLEGEDRDVALDFVRSTLDGLADGFPLMPLATSARTGEGMDALRASLRRMADEDERTDLLMRSGANLARDAARATSRAARFEAHALALPLDELRRRSDLFERRIADLRGACAEAGDLLDHGVRRAVRELVDEPLTGYVRVHGDRLRESLRTHVDRLGTMGPGALATELSRWIDATVRDEFAAVSTSTEQRVAEELARLERLYGTRVEQILGEIGDIASDVFGADAGVMPPTAGLTEPSRFTFKLTDVEQALEMIAGLGRRLAPGGLGRRLVVRDAEQRLIGMTDRHAGRLRSELVERVIAATRDYRRGLAATVDGAIDAITAAIGRADAEHRRMDADGRARRTELEDIAERCDAIAGERDASPR